MQKALFAAALGLSSVCHAALVKVDTYLTMPWAQIDSNPTGNIEAAITDFKVYRSDYIVGPMVTYEQDFATNANGFTPVEGTWTVSGGQYHLSTAVNSSATSHLTNRTLYNQTLDQFSMQANALIPSGQTTIFNDFALIFGYQNPSNYYFASFNESDDNLTNGIFKVANNVTTELTDFAQNIVVGQTYNIRVDRYGDEIEASLNGETIGTFTDDTFVAGKIGLGTRNNKATFDNWFVVDDDTTVTQGPWELVTDPTEKLALLREWYSQDFDPNHTWQVGEIMLSDGAGGWYDGKTAQPVMAHPNLFELDVPIYLDMAAYSDDLRDLGVTYVNGNAIPEPRLGIVLLGVLFVSRKALFGRNRHW